MSLLRDAREIGVAEATRRGVAGLVADAEHGSDLVVTRRRRPVAVVLGAGRLADLERTLTDMGDLALVLARSTADTGRRTSLDEVLTAFGRARESLATLPDD
ncbi:MAG TPA: hypothetical protein VFX70_02610 [Mycobacteriales bacterium]|nr:hypothetical protein [Mycobacteriales bacterium]